MRVWWLPVTLGVLVLMVSGLTRVAADAPATDAFSRTWSRTDKPVADQIVERTWMWGPEGFTGPIVEDYVGSPEGRRVVQYFDKSRMEDNAYRGADPWDVTNGLLVIEMVEGRVQTGDAEYDESREPAEVNIVGDPGERPTYADIDRWALRSEIARPVGTVITQTIDDGGTVGFDDALARHGVTAAERVTVDGIDHTVASPFWTFMNAVGTIYDSQQFVEASLFQSPYYATGYPITEAWWSRIAVGGVERDVLWQCFQRRCLTYTPSNEPTWRVEAGNVGRHYYEWRYGGEEPVPAPTATQVSPVDPTETPSTGPSPTETATPPVDCHPSYPDFCIPPPPPDLNCSDFTAAQRPFVVRHDVPDPDPHDLDRDKNGVACTN